MKLSQELEDYAKQYKSSIQSLIEQGLLQEAKYMLKEYEKVVREDVEIYSIKGVIAMMEGDMDEAEGIMKAGLKLFSGNFDLLYNLGYLYQCKSNNEMAMSFYKKALSYADSDQNKNAVYQMMYNQECNKDIKSIENENRVVTGYPETKLSHQQQIIIKNMDHKTMPSPDANIFDLRGKVASVLLDEDAPLVSIMVLALNNLEKYTKKCIECILKYTHGIDYELVLVDNGSTDGTFEYFKSVSHDKKTVIRITKNLGSAGGGIEGLYHCRGRYITAVPYDVFVTKNWLSNMLKCAMSDPRIGMITPVADYVSNLQSVDLEYDDFDDMQVKAAEFNISNPQKWHERLRLITLGTLYKKECLDMVGLPDYGFFHDFSDDDITFRVRRAGYKAILCKDVFVCHAGKSTDKGSDVAKKSLQKGRITFQAKHFGIDAWDDVNNFEKAMMSLIKVNQKKKIYKILGVDVLCGTPLLEAKNTLKEKGLFNVSLSAFTTQAKYWLDLSTICDNEVKCDRIDFIREHFEVNSFDLIILGKHLNGYTLPYKVLTNIFDLLVNDGRLLIKVRNNYDIRNFLYQMRLYPSADEEVVSHIDINILKTFLENRSYDIEQITGENHIEEEDIKKYILNLLGQANNVNDADGIINNLMVKDYVLSLRKGNINR